VCGLESPVLLGDSIELAPELIVFRAQCIAGVVDGGPAVRRLRGRDHRGVRDQEFFIALLAADLPADKGRPDAQRGQAVRTVHDDPLRLGRGRGRRLACRGAFRFLVLCGHEDLVAFLAADLLADIDSPDPQLGRAMRAMGEEVGLGVDHGITLACRQWMMLIHAGFVELAP
jgi:hypothetical protein